MMFAGAGVFTGPLPASEVRADNSAGIHWEFSAGADVTLVKDSCGIWAITNKKSEPFKVDYGTGTVVVQANSSVIRKARDIIIASKDKNRSGSISLLAAANDCP